jgi:integrase
MMLGVPMSVIQTLMRHKQLTMTQQYTHVPPAAMQSAIGLLNNRVEESVVGNMLATGPAPTAKVNG